MVRRKLAAALAAMALATAMILPAAGCANGESSQESPYGPGEPPLMPASHEGRYESLGASGCYGCHGANDASDHMLDAAPPLPADHYVDSSVDSHEVFGPRGECITCHPQG